MSQIWWQEIGGIGLVKALVHGVPLDVPENGESQKAGGEDEAHQPNANLPALFFSVLQYNQPNTETCKGASHVGQVACVPRRAVHEAGVDGEAGVAHGIDDDGHEAHEPVKAAALGHLELTLAKPLSYNDNILLPVEGEGGKVGRNEAVDPAAGPTKVHVRVATGCGQRTGHHAAHVNNAQAQRAVRHLQGQADKQLDQQVHPDVAHARVDEGVADKPPDLPPAVGVVDQHRALGRRLAPSDVQAVVDAEMVGVDDKEEGLDEGEAEEEHGRGPTLVHLCKRGNTKRVDQLG